MQLCPVRAVVEFIEEEGVWVKGTDRAKRSAASEYGVGYAWLDKPRAMEQKVFRGSDGISAQTGDVFGGVVGSEALDM